MSSAGDGDGAGGRLAGTLAGILAGVLVFLLIVVGLLWFGEPGAEGNASLSATPVTAGPATGTPDGPGEATTPATDALDDEPVDGPAGDPEPEVTEREPTDADAARFASAFEPPGGEGVESVTVDVTGDGWPEIVVVSIAQGTVRLDVARWTGATYEVVFSDVGGRADEVVRFLVRDLGGDGVRDIATVQSDGGTESLALWGWDGQAFARQEAQGGCWHGSHVFGAGAELRDGEITADCDGSPDPPPGGGTDVYRWHDGAWRHERSGSP